MEEEKERGIKTPTVIEILILAIIQGVTEWLPISSSGHLVIAQEYMGLSLPVFFDIVLHVGSLLVVLIVFRSDIFKILRAFWRLDFKSEEVKLAFYVILGSIPTAIIGFIFKDLFESFFNNLIAVGIAFIVTGSFLSVSERTGNHDKPFGYLDAVLIGAAQGIALIPGISRSGITITAGLLRKVGKKTAFRYSFLLFIPAVVGATIFTAPETENLMTANIDYSSMLLGIVITVVVGYVSLKLLLRIVLREKFHLFAYYCWAIGFLVLLTQVLGRSGF